MIIDTVNINEHMRMIVISDYFSPLHCCVTVSIDVCCRQSYLPQLQINHVCYTTRSFALDVLFL